MIKPCEENEHVMAELWKATAEESSHCSRSGDPLVPESDSSADFDADGPDLATATSGAVSLAAMKS
jgi:hypothetical protein